MEDPIISKFESVTERRIREAMERGEFDNLPGAGKPIPGDARPYDPAWWARRYMERLRADEARHERIRELTGLIHECWSLPEPDARRQFAEISTEWARLRAEDASLPDPIPETDFITIWKHLRSSS